MRILIVDDCAPARRLLERNLVLASHGVKLAGSCAEAGAVLAMGAFDVIVLDVMLPDGCGIDLCKRLRAARLATPILLLTARGEVRDRVRGLNAGADDYLANPFAVAELNARVNALGRRGPIVRDQPASAYTADITAVLKLIPDRKRRLVLYCNGLHCGRSKRFAAELRNSGYADVRRYQLGIPAWRALGGVAQVEKDALVSLVARDATAVLIDAREPAARPRIAKAVAIPLRDASKAKDDGRLPMTDHNTRIFVVGENGNQARAVAEAIVRDAFHNVSFFGGGVADLSELVTRD